MVVSPQEADAASDWACGTFSVRCMLCHLADQFRYFYPSILAPSAIQGGYVAKGFLRFSGLRREESTAFLFTVQTVVKYS